MKKYKRIFTIVIDSLGIGALEDSEQFGDKGVNTLGHIAERMENFQIPNLRKVTLLLRITPVTLSVNISSHSIDNQ